MTSFNWPLVRHLAEGKLGVGTSAYHVWYCRRNVPHKYRLQIVAMSAGAITAEDFYRLDRAAKRKKRANPVELNGSATA